QTQSHAQISLPWSQVFPGRSKQEDFAIRRCWDIHLEATQSQWLHSICSMRDLKCPLTLKPECEGDSGRLPRASQLPCGRALMVEILTTANADAPGVELVR